MTSTPAPQTSLYARLLRLDPGTRSMLGARTAGIVTRAVVELPAEMAMWQAVLDTLDDIVLRTEADRLRERLGPFDETERHQLAVRADVVLSGNPPGPLSEIWSAALDALAALEDDGRQGHGD
jgi:hypothetical protein